MNKLAFLSTPAPASPAREGPSEETIAEAKRKRAEDEEGGGAAPAEPEQFQDPDNEYGLFASDTYEADDVEADLIYEFVDRNMDARRRARREARENEELIKARAERPKLQSQFSDLKRGLSVVTDEECESIPEVGNLTRRKRRRETYDRAYVMPDSVIVGDRAKDEYENVLDPMQQKAGGLETPLECCRNRSGARDKILSLKLDQAPATSVDPRGYLTSLNNIVLKIDAEIGDIKRARRLFDSLVKSNTKHAPGWIAAACSEEHAGRMVEERGCMVGGG